MYNKLFWECDLWSSICNFLMSGNLTSMKLASRLYPTWWYLNPVTLLLEVIFGQCLPLLPEEGSWVWLLYQIPFPRRQDLVCVGFVPGTHHRHSCWARRPHSFTPKSAGKPLIVESSEMSFINQTSSPNAIVYYLKIMIEWWRSSNQSHKGQESCQKREDNPIEFSARCCATGPANHLELWVNLDY